MSLTSRILVAVLATTGLALTTPASNAVASPRECAPPPPADVTTAEGWIGYLADHPRDSAYLVNDGRGGIVAHRAGARQPVASAVKVLHLAAYARAVARDEIDPKERVTVGEWERWWVPGTDGGNHLKALDRLGISYTEAGATDPTQKVRLDAMVSAMIQESDNAVPDYLRDRLGDKALVRAGKRGGWGLKQLPTLAGQTISLLVPSVRKVDRWDAAQRYASDPTYRAEVLTKTVDPARLARWVRSTFTASPRQLAGLHRALATRSFGPGSGVALRHLEWQPSPKGLKGLGFKGGSYPGILTDAFEARRKDGTVAVGALLNRNLTTKDMTAALEAGLPQQTLLVGAMLDPEALARLRCVA